MCKTKIKCKGDRCKSEQNTQFNRRPVFKGHVHESMKKLFFSKIWYIFCNLNPKENCLKSKTLTFHNFFVFWLKFVYQFQIDVPKTRYAEIFLLKRGFKKKIKVCPSFRFFWTIILKCPTKNSKFHIKKRKFSTKNINSIL